MGVTIEQIEDALSKTLIGKPPKEIFILDGVINVPTEEGVKYAIAMAKPHESVAVFTPLSRIDSIYHEMLHQGLFGMGLLKGEMIADLGGKLLAFKYQLPGVKKREVKYELCINCSSHEEILDRLGIKPLFKGEPVIKHYLLVKP
ncbi:MAG: hypothetical protein NZ957_05845 [Thaumarchaeota archaeon]|nr:hypothetical protein [Candidatus Calditenuaceae archaeon]